MGEAADRQDGQAADGQAAARTAQATQEARHTQPDTQQNAGQSAGQDAGRDAPDDGVPRDGVPDDEVPHDEVPHDGVPPVAGKVAVVTGAGSGIGRAVAQALAAAGWDVVLAGRRAEALAETARLLGLRDPDGPAVIRVPTDVTRPAEVDALFTTVRDRFGRLDLLFNNAGTFGRSAPLDELTYDDWQSVVDVNLTGAFLCAQAAFRTMKAQDPQGGRIINNGSLSAHVPRPDSVAYTATKHAMTGLTKSLSLDGRPYRIACGQLDIGNAATAMTGRMRTGIRQADGRTAAEPVMAAADVARTVVHMAALPLEANVQFATVMATNMPYIGRG